MLKRNKIAIVVVGFGIAVASTYQIGTSDAVVTRLLRAQIAKIVHAPCTFRSASFTFLHGIAVSGLVVLDPTAPLGQPLIQAEHARVDYSLGLLGVGFHITLIEIEAPRLKIERTDDGSLPILSAILFPKAGGEPMRPFVATLSHGAVTFSDPTVLAGAPLELSDISIAVTPDGPYATEWTDAAVRLHATSDLLGPLDANVVLGTGNAPDAVSLDLAKIRIDPALAGRFTGALAKRIADLAPSGEATAHVEARLDRDKVVAQDASVEIRDVAVRVGIPDSTPGEPAPKPFDVTGIHGHLHFAADRLDATDLSLTCFGAEFRVDAALSGVTGTAPAIDAKVAVHRLAATPALRAFLPFGARRVAEALDLVATIDATATVRGPTSAPTIAVAASFDHAHASFVGYVQENGLRHGFPFDGDDLAGKVAFVDHVLRIDAAGRHGPAKIRVNGTVTMHPGAHDVSEIMIVADDVPLDDDVRRGFETPERMNQSFGQFEPSGTAAHVTVHVFQDPKLDAHDVAEVAIEFDGRANFRPVMLPEPLHGMSGRVEIDYPVVNGRREESVVLAGVRAAGDGFDLRIDGVVGAGGPPDVAEDLRLAVDVAEAGTGFRRGLDGSPNVPQGAKAVAAKLGVTGPLSVSAHLVKHVDGSHDDHVEFTLKGASVRGWGDIPLAARDLMGKVTVDHDVVTFEGFAGELSMAPFFPRFTAHGRLFDINTDPQSDVHVDAVDLPLAEPLRAALGPLAETAREFWNRLDPAAGARADCALDLRPRTDATPVEVTLSRMRGPLRPLGLELDVDAGSFHYDGRHAQAHGLDAAIGAASIRFEDADYDIEAKTLDLRASARGLRFPEDLEGPLTRETVDKIAALAPARTLHASDLHVVYKAQDEGGASLSIVGPTNFRPRTRRPLPDPGYEPEGVLVFDRLVFHMPEQGEVSYEGEAHAQDFAVRAGLEIDKLTGPLAFAGAFSTPAQFKVTTTNASLRVADFPLERADIDAWIVPQGGAHADVKAKFADGDFAAVVDPGRNGVGYHGELHLAGVELERFLRQRGDARKDVATGKVDADVRFHNDTGVLADLRGPGKMTVHDGRLMSAPGISELFLRAATAGLFAPALTDGEMKFELLGDSIDVSKLEVTGSGMTAITDGTGRIAFDGRIDMSVDARLFSVPIPVVSTLVELFQKPWPTRIRITGTLRNPKTQLEGYHLRSIGASGRREPQPIDDERPPGRDPW